MVDDIQINDTWFPANRFLKIAGPCSAETEEQVMTTAAQIKALQPIDYFRAGVWKPRTRPNNFEGIGADALKWLNRVQDELGLKVAIEVANAKHVELALEAGIDLIWVGARTTVNPFSVQEIADAVKGVDIPILVKNPINVDYNLWVGALERFSLNGIKKLGAIHRGFSGYSLEFRNVPNWELPIRLKSEFPELPVIVDPSHILGKRTGLGDIAQKALDIGLNGIMLEVHNNPDEAWSDAFQQIVPADYNHLMDKLKFRRLVSEGDQRIEQLRVLIDEIDFQILEKLKERFDAVAEIGEWKKKNDVAIYQIERWRNIKKTRMNFGSGLGLDDELVMRLLDVIHEYSIDEQRKIFLKRDS